MSTGNTGAKVLSRPESLSGARLGSYTLLDQIGWGAMCVVYRARHEGSGREFAIKVLQFGRPSLRNHIQRMRREATVVLKIDHPNVVKALEFGTAPRIGVYLVLELLPGTTLQEVLQLEGPLDPVRSARIAKQTALGLTAAHRAGYVHRDLKPANLMLVGPVANETVKILDFGIVGLLRAANGCMQLTQDDLIVGTPSHMAPEQFESSNVGPRADIYALGAILYHMLSGRPPFIGSMREIIAQHLMAPPDPLPIFAGLGPLAHAMLQKRPEDRPESAEAVAAALDALLPEIEGFEGGGDVLRAPALADVAEETAPVPTLNPASAQNDPPGGDEWIREITPGSCFERQRVDAEQNRGTPRSSPSPSALTPLRWPLRIAIPLVLSLAVLGGALAAKQLLSPGSGGPEVASEKGRTPRETMAADSRAAAESSREATVYGTEGDVDDAEEILALKRKLQWVSDALVEAVGSIPETQHQNFEERYLDLSQVVRPGLSPIGRASLGNRIESLHAQILIVLHRHGRHRP